MLAKDAALWLVAGNTVLVDQLTKQLIVGHLRVGESVALVADALRFGHVRNPIGLLQSFADISQAYRALVFLLVPVVILASLLVGVRKLECCDVRFAAALSLVMGGSLGNLLDRLFRHSVVDFIEIQVGPVKFPSFNVADLAMLVGTSLLLAAVVRAARASQLRAPNPANDPRRG